MSRTLVSMEEPVRHGWTDLPAAVRRAVEETAGPVDAVEHVGTGSVAQFAAVLTSGDDRGFCKGVAIDSSAARHLRNEIRLNPSLPTVVPRLRWSVEDEGWLLAGFEHVPGRHPDLSPGSPDLDAVAELLTALGHATPRCMAPVQPFAKRWANLISPELVDGATLLHTDMSPRNILLTDRPWLVDWAAPARGAAWIDPAFTIVRLIRYGHPPEAAEAWATARIPTYAAADPAAVTAWVAALVKLWTAKQATTPADHRAPLLAAAQRWHAHRSLSDAARPSDLVGNALHDCRHGVESVVVGAAQRAVLDGDHRSDGARR